VVLQTIFNEAPRQALYRARFDIAKESDLRWRRRLASAQRALRAATALLARRSMYARLACSARRRHTANAVAKPAVE
jgi:hypothetical protein